MIQKYKKKLQDYFIEAMKLSKLSVETTPASLQLSASFMAESVKALGTSSIILFWIDFIISHFNDYGNIRHQTDIQ